MSSIIWHSTAPWAPSGYGNQTAIWTRKLIEMGHEVAISSYWGLSGSPTEWHGIPVLPGFGHAYCSASLYEHAKALNPDIVITLGDIWVMDPNLLRELPVAHWLPSDCRPMSSADRSIVDATGDEVIAMSKFGFDRFTDAGLNPLYVPHGIDTDLYAPGGDKAAIREKFGLQQDEFVIGVNAANNDAVRKAAPEMFLAFAKFLVDHPDAILAVHAGVHSEGGQDLEFLAESLGITDRVRVTDQYHYHAGMVSQKELADWYHAIDVLAACTYAEGFGLPIMEAQACGTPVITTKASSMEELNPYGIQIDGTPFWNGVHKGWWIRPDIQQMVDAFAQAYETVPERGKLREFAETYSIDNVAEKYMGPAVGELAQRMANRAR